jgi:hypothetical protein
MAPPRKKRRAAGEGHPLHLRLPSDVMKRIEAKTKEKGWPLNRVIINELAAFPDLDQLATLGERIADMEVILDRYGSRITWLDLSEEMLNAVDAVLKADGSAREAAIDKLSLVRRAMLKSKFIEQTAKQ